MKYLDLLRRYPRYIAYAALHYFFSGPGQSFYISLYTVSFLTALNIDQQDFTWIYFGATMLSSFIMPSVGKLLDRLMLRKFSVILGLVFAGFCILAALVTHPIILFAALAGLRLCGQGLMPLTGSTAISRFFEKERGQALALSNLGVSISEMILPVFIYFLIAQTSWQLSYLIMGGIILFLFIPLVIMLVPKTSAFQFNPQIKSPKENQSVQQSVSRAEVLRSPYFYVLLLISLFWPFFFTGVIINKNLIGDINGWTEIQLSLALTIFGTTRFLMNFVGGTIIDRISATRTFAFALIPVGLGILGLALGNDHVGWLYLFFVGNGVSASFLSLTSSAMWAELYGTGHFAAIRSIYSTAMQVSTAIAPVILGGILVEQSSLFPLMGSTTLVLIVFVVLSYWVVRRVRA